MKNFITFLVSSVILTVLVYLYFYATNGDNAIQEMEAYKDWIAVAVILLSIAVAYVAARIRRRREDELDFGQRPNSVSRVVRQSAYNDNAVQSDETNSDIYSDQDGDVSTGPQSNDDDFYAGFYDHTAFVHYVVGDDEPYEDFVHVGVEDDEFDELSEAEYNGRYLDMDFIAENFSGLHDRIIDAIRQQVMEEYYSYFYSEANNYLNPREYPLDSSVDYDVLNLE